MTPACATLIHRYSFTTDVSDSVGTANGTNLLNTAQHPGANPVVYNGGQAVMDGSGGYIQLPAGLVSGLTNLTVEVQPDDAAYLQFTSGSTGVPKGILVTHRQSFVAQEHNVIARGFTPQDRLLYLGDCGL